ncbi:hypothetical protein [Pinirhizobacter soli]|uniref:hypothetical protein n=1 Tax=Pinirhizobacter soli TaxID=2786953 RepID=UPI002029BD58|nr:hypothetical protein [Pinirhizobacter soli]
MIVKVELPAVFVESEEFRALPEDQRQSLLRRLDNTKSLGLSLESGSRLASASDFTDFTEDLELDVALLQELDSADRGGLSRWQLHFTWSFETSPERMRQALPAFCVELLDAHEPSQDAQVDSYNAWFIEIGGNLVKIIDCIETSTTFDAVLAAHIVLDIVLGRLLVACYKIRLNRLMPR